MATANLAGFRFDHLLVLELVEVTRARGGITCRENSKRRPFLRVVGEN